MAACDNLEYITESGGGGGGGGGHPASKLPAISSVQVSIKTTWSRP